MDLSKHLEKAVEFQRRRQYDVAIELYRQLLDLDADLYDARRGLRQALKARAEAGGGSKFLRAISGAVPLTKARALAKVGQHEAAARALEDYLLKSPLDAEANLALGDSLEAAGHLKSARAVFEFVSEIAPKNASGWKRAGALQSRAGDHAQAIQCYERALAIDPRDQEAIHARKNLAAEAALAGNRLEQVGHSREVAKERPPAEIAEQARRRTLTPEELEAERARLEERFAADPRDVATMRALAKVHEQLKDAEAALDLVERALSYSKGDAELADWAGELRGKVLRRRLAQASREGDEGRAEALEREIQEHEVADVERRLARRPGDGALMLELARRQLKAGRPDEALGQLQKLPDGPGLAREGALLKARCFEQKGFQDLAVREYERALEGLPAADERAKEIRYTLGELALAGGRRDEARRLFSAVFEVDIQFRDVAQRMEQLR